MNSSSFFRVSRILIFIFFFSCIHLNIHADVPAYIYESDDYKEWINNTVIKSDYPPKNDFGFHANKEIYDKDIEAHKAFKIVYGIPKDVSNNEKDHNDEWRYLGFDMKGNIVSNEDFTNDREIGEDEKFTEWIFKDSVIGAQQSWDNARLYFRPEIIEYNKKTEWLKEGKKTGLSVNFKNLNDEHKVLLLGAATFLTEGSVRIEHYVNGSKYYSTFTIPAMAKLKGIIEAEGGTIGATEDSVDIPLGSSAYFEHDGYLEKNKHLISELKVDVTEYNIDSGETVVINDKEKYGETNSEVIKVGRKDFITFTRQDFTKETSNNEHFVQFIGEASFKSDLTGENQKKPLNITVKIIIEDLDDSAKKINVKHFEKDSEDGSASLLGESNVSVKEDEASTVEALAGKKLLETKFGPDVSLMDSSEDRSVKVTADKFIMGDTYYIEFYYEKIIPVMKEPKGGGISFDPDETEWTKKGRITNGKGVYPVNVTYDGDNPAIGQGRATFHYIIEQEAGADSGDGEAAVPLPPIEYDIDVPIEVKYPLDEIKVNGSALNNEVIIKGDSGTVDIVKEGYRMQLNAKGKFGEKQYDEPEPPQPDPASVVEDIPEAPADPVGSSGLYNIDWTDPTISFSMDGNDGFKGTITIGDNLSGICESTYQWIQDHEENVGFDYEEHIWIGGSNTYSYYDDRYERIEKVKNSVNIEKDTPEGGAHNFTQGVTKPRGDHWYLHVWTKDRAGNKAKARFGPYNDPIKLRDLRVIDINDPAWTPQFWDLKAEPKTLRKRKFGVNEMPIDERTNGGIPGINISKGYAVVFEITSEYLDFREDTIVIKPTFFYLKDGERIPCDLYYQLEKNPFIKYGSEDDKFNVYYTEAIEDNVTGTFTRLELEKNERQVKSEDENVWRFKYYIHYNTYAVEKGKKVYAYPTSALKDGEFLIQFDVKAYRNNEVKPHDFWMRYDYIVENWEKEGGNTKAKKPGDVLIFDDHSIIDDYDAGGVH